MSGSKDDTTNDSDNFAVSYLRLVELNNTGAALATLGASSEADLQRSIALFRAAVQNAAMLIRKVEADDSCPMRDNAAADAELVTGVDLREWSTAPEFATPCNHLLLCLGGVSSDDNDVLSASCSGAWDCAFLRPFFVLPGIHAYSDDNLTNISLVMIIVLFNLGISFHRLGSLGNDDGIFPYANLLLKAQSLYIKAKTILSQIVEVGSLKQGGGVLDLLIVACQNNIAHVSYALGDFEAFRVSSHQLYNYALRMDVAALCNDPVTTLLLQHYKNKFINHALFLRRPTLAAAA